MPIYFQNIKDITPQLCCHRCGVIPYSILPDNTILFALGLDSKSKELTDFGGHSLPYESAVTAAMREFNEESLGIFEDIDIKDIQNQLVVHNNHDFVIFLNLDIDLLSIDKIFYRKWKQKINEKYNVENCAILWFTAEQIYKLLSHKIIYHPLIPILKTLPHILSLL